MPDDKMKHAVKDSVFSLFFREPENMHSLYQALHPEDTTSTPEDCKLVTLEHVLINGLTNDLGFTVRNRLIMLTEAQAKFSRNITLRFLLYLAASYKEYLDDHKLDLHASKAVTIPRPELYMIYAGAPRRLPQSVYLSELFADGPGGVELEVKILHPTGSGDVIDQYIEFCAICDEQRRLYGRTGKAMEEILRICKERNILMPFLLTREKEVRDIMVTLFDQDYLSEIHDYNLKKDYLAKGEERGKRLGRQQGQQQAYLTSLQSLMSTLGFSADQALAALKIPESDWPMYRERLGKSKMEPM